MSFVVFLLPPLLLLLLLLLPRMPYSNPLADGSRPWRKEDNADMLRPSTAQRTTPTHKRKKAREGEKLP